MTFNQICKDIKSIKIQGAENVAKAGLRALRIKNTYFSRKKLLKQRPTEPCLKNAINYAQKHSIDKALKYIDESGEKLAKIGQKIIKKTVFTHCHSSTVIDIMREAKKKKSFQVFNTETRPLFQGRKTAKDLKKLRIKTTTVVDSAAAIAMKKSKVMLIGADAILPNGDVINKVGSGMFAEIAKENKIPVYVAAISWKYSTKKLKIEQRSPLEIWKTRKYKIKNPAFEIVKAENIKGIISEKGIHSPKQFVRLMK